jgi:hypothetical protein
MTEVDLNNSDDCRTLAEDLLLEARSLRSDAKELEEEADQLFKKARKLENEP